MYFSTFLYLPFNNIFPNFGSSGIKDKILPRFVILVSSVYLLTIPINASTYTNFFKLNYNFYCSG